MSEEICPMTKARMVMALDASTGNSGKASIAFIYHIVRGMPIVVDPKAGTACTNGISIMYNPEWLATVEEKYHQTILLHEVLHCMGMDMFRLKGADPKIANVAMDLVRNWDLKNRWKFPMPDDACYDHEGRYVSTGDETVEEVYAKLMQEKQKQEKGGNKGWPMVPSKNGSNGSGDKEGESVFGKSYGDCREPTQEELNARGLGGKEELKQEIKGEIQQASMAARKKGDLPDSVMRLIDQAVVPRRSLWDCLVDIIRHNTREDYSWRKPSRTRLLCGDLYPGIYSEGMGAVVVAIDTSGSMTQNDLAKASGGINSLVSEFNPSEVVVIYCNSQVMRTDRFERGEAITLSAVGGGGTAFQPVFDWAAANLDAPPELLIYFTDLFGDSPNDPGYPTVWVNTYNGTYKQTELPSFGTIVDFD